MPRGVQIQVLLPVPTKYDQKDIVPAKGCVKPIVGIIIARNRIHAPQIFSTEKWT